MTTLPAPQKIIELVEDFKENKHEYTNPDIFDEENTKVKFLNPFFEELGWNVRNEGLSARFREVVFEDSIKVGSKTKAPDYSFRLGGERIFFVEAKKPNQDLASNKEHAFQVRRYGWSAKLPLCILTDFEEFAIYDTTIKPDKNQNASIGRIKYYKYTDYVDKWDEIYNIFSKDAVLSGKFDNYANNVKHDKKGTSEVDDEFLKEIEHWRLLLARNIALRNTELSIEDLNYAVQLTIDRIIFLRIAEDRGIERYGQLEKLLQKENIYAEFAKICKKADEKYNSGLFHFNPYDKEDFTTDTYTLDVTIDDAVFEEIFKNLYYPNSPYEFSLISTEILGKIYEQFLGQVIRLTPGHQAKVEEKPEVKKAGGVYYTPQYIVDYIVENTLGEKIKGMTPNQISAIKVIDPACGSGSFLIRAYQYLLDYHLEYYTTLERPPKDVIYEGKDGKPRLTITEKKRILKNNIYGVDIDTLAVEVTKLSLLLKVLEDQNKDLLEAQQKLFHERALPNLSNNIKNGNSLIEYDILEQEKLTSENIKEIKPFDWEEEYEEIFKQGGFDVVIGNPPYGYHEIHSEITKNYFKKRYTSSKGSFEHYFIFYELSLRLLKTEGLHGFIVPVTWISIPSALSLRKYILNNYSINELDWFNYFVFDEAKVNTLISIIKKSNMNKTKVKIFDNEKLSKPSEERNYLQDRFITLDYSINIFEDEDEMKILEKIIKNSFQLKDIAKPCSGYNPYEKGKGKAPHGGVQTKKTVEEKPYHSTRKIDETWKPEIIGRNLSRYHLTITNNRWIKYGPWLAAPRKPENFNGIRLLVQEVTGGDDKRIVATYCDEELYYSRDVIPIKVDSKEVAFIILAILNSDLITWYHHKRNPKSQKALFPKILVSDLKKLPLSNHINWNSLENNIEIKLIELVKKIINLNDKLYQTETPTERKLLQKQIDITDKKINELVYELYDLTPEEIDIIENSL